MARSQLKLLKVDPRGEPSWAQEGRACESCDGGQLYMVAASAPCTCDEPICECLAEGYAKCDGCGALSHVWPREMVAQWTEQVSNAS